MTPLPLLKSSSFSLMESKLSGLSQRFIEMTAITSNKLSFFSSRYKWVCTGAWKMLTRHVSELGWLIQMYLSSWLHPAEWQMWRYVQNSLFLSYSRLLPISFAFKCEKRLVFFGSLRFWTVATSLSLPRKGLTNICLNQNYLLWTLEKYNPRLFPWWYIAEVCPLPEDLKTNCGFCTWITASSFCSFFGLFYQIW